MIEVDDIALTSGNSDDERIKGFLRDCELRRLSPTTIEGYRSNLHVASQVLRREGLNISKLDKSSLKCLLEFLIRQGYVYNTMLQYFAALSGFCDYLVWEGLTEANPVVPFRKRYVRQFKKQQEPERKLISVDEMAMLINSVMDPRDKAILTLFAKTGIRRGELIKIDVEDIDWIEQCVRLKPHPKRTNLTVFFDDETARVLKRWMVARENFKRENACKALFLNERGEDLNATG
jgi:integrase/recombinase XerD